eukprot:gnl/TRDRNA2_/TRDRNA2_64825_c0_seq1.p1 gnl/TRDRNA2_/TRDRNA2_64825_c0~~gnl/TRDRNA2_/TRDRNA2_64825_c0_seq1.p1  ORF type:complete len:520 (+),score=74.10 gnl/TRDRNA2_/TRDRNA2_64825_c0_seq1:73-1632(+)
MKTPPKSAFSTTAGEKPVATTAECLKCRTVWETIDDIGIGRYQFAAQFCSAGLFFVDGATIQTMSMVTKPLGRDLHLHAGEKAVLVSMIYVGCLVGNLVGGVFSDKIGRRASILVGYAVLMFVALLSCACESFYALFVCQLIFGMCFGFGIPSVSAMIAEITPQSWRMTVAGANSVYFAAGCLYSILVMAMDDTQIDHAHWRVQVAMSGVPPVVFGIAALFFLYESPAFLATQGRISEAESVLEVMRAQNAPLRANEAVIKIRKSGRVYSDDAKMVFREHLWLIFGRHSSTATFTLCMSAFALMFIFYGNLYAFGKVLPDLKMGGSATMSLILGVLMGDVPGSVLGIVWGPSMLRRRAMLIYTLSAAACAMLFAWRSDNTTQDSPFPSVALLFVGYLGGRFFISLGYAMLWQYAAEVFPTAARSTGLAVALACGRVGSLIAPPLYEALHAVSQAHAPYFCAGAALLVLNAFLAATYLPETKDKHLDMLLPADDMDAEVCMPLNVGGASGPVFDLAGKKL